MTQRKRHIVWFMLLLCVFVFLFTLAAKLSLYDQPVRATATNSSKLWLNGQKLEAQAPQELGFVLLSVAFLFFRILFHREQWQSPEYALPIPSQLSSFELHRFLRPPPRPSLRLNL